MTATHAAVTEQSTRLLIASTILEQLGGVRRLSVMTGAKDFIALPDGVMFKLGAKATMLDSTHYVYCDMLARVFENRTGFYLSL